MRLSSYMRYGAGKQTGGWPNKAGNLYFLLKSIKFGVFVSSEFFNNNYTLIDNTKVT